MGEFYVVDFVVLVYVCAVAPGGWIAVVVEPVGGEVGEVEEVDGVVVVVVAGHGAELVLVDD